MEQEFLEYELSILTKQAALELSRVVSDNCSYKCDIDEIETRLIINFNEEDFNLYKSKFRCFDNCLHKHFNSAFIGLQAIKFKTFN